MLAINSADDERNPPETGIMEREIKRVKNGKLYLIPASTQTRGHGTTGDGEILQAAAPGIAQDRAATGDVGARVIPARHFYFSQSRRGPSSG